MLLYHAGDALDENFDLSDEEQEGDDETGEDDDDVGGSDEEGDDDNDLSALDRRRKERAAGEHPLQVWRHQHDTIQAQ